jgi:mannosyltransferase OCH1-like enzyme
MIPKIIHQIWVGEYNLPTRERKISSDIKEKHPEYTYYLWTDKNLPSIPERLQKMYDTMYERKDYVFCADMLRWIVVHEYGGWYLDIDWEFIQTLDSLNLENRSGIVFGHWGVGWQHCDYTITNNVYAFEKNHPIVKHMIDSMPIEYGYCNAPYSPGWTGLEIKKYLGLDNEFSNEIWHYHSVVRENLDRHNIEYGDYNTFQNEVLKHHALYSWEHTNKEKFAKGLID